MFQMVPLSFIFSLGLCLDYGAEGRKEIYKECFERWTGNRDKNACNDRSQQTVFQRSDAILFAHKLHDRLHSYSPGDVVGFCMRVLHFIWRRDTHDEASRPDAWPWPLKGGVSGKESSDVRPARKHGSFIPALEAQAVITISPVDPRRWQAPLPRLETCF